MTVPPDDALAADAALVAGDDTFALRRLASPDEAAQCAAIMSSSDPWLTLGRGFEASLAGINEAGQEVFVALDAAGRVAGFVLLVMQGAFIGYVRTIAIHASRRSRGLGAALLGAVERHVHRTSPNVYLCVSSFNPRARAFYERLGYSLVGELTDYFVRGYSELLMRKSLAPLSEWRPAGAATAPEAPPASP
jgi:ribosomal-protein-alanine N-acetyltransferase